MNDRRESDKLGFWSIVLLAINSIIGSGIFLTPGSVVSRVGKIGRASCRERVFSLV